MPFTIKAIIVTPLLLASIPTSADIYKDPIPYSNFIIVFLLICCLLQAFIIIGLKRIREKYLDAEEELKTKHKDLEARVLERSEKLYNLNSQLYDEIANHEVTEELLRATQSYIQNIINSMPSIIIGVTRDGIITHWNTAARQATGINYDKALGFLLADIAPELNIDESLIDRAIDLQKTQKRENRQEGHGSQAKYSDLTIYPLLSTEVAGAVIRIDDVTLSVRLETMMIQNEKMNSLGELAAGVAHEINNPLGTILQSIQNIKRRTSKTLAANRNVADDIGISLKDMNEYLKNRRVLDFLDDIKEAGERATLIVRNMLEFSREQNKQFDSVDIKDLLDRSIELALHSMNTNQTSKASNTNILKFFPDDCPSVRCSAAEIQQVILNLMSNAHHAFSEADQDGKLEIAITLSFTKTAVKIEIKDNGPGMDSWTQRHIFDPFFTTKDVGKGTGLGLSVSYFIITEHHRGSITVDSEEGKGATFTIQIPLENN